MERFETQLQVRLAREQLRWERREARWARRQLKLDVRSVKPVDTMSVKMLKKPLIKLPVYKKAKPKEREKPKPVAIKPVKKRPKLKGFLKKVKEPVEIKKEIYKEPKIEKAETEIPDKPREIIVEEKPIEEAVKLTTNPVRYRCMMCGTISPELGICCGKEMEEWVSSLGIKGLLKPI